MLSQSSPIFDFIVDSLKISNSPFNIINTELIMAQCQVAVPRTFFTEARMETLNLQMVCNPDILSKYPGSELVIKGSYRLQWFIDGIRERGLIAGGTVAYDLDPRKTQREIIALLREQPQFFFEQPTLIYNPELLVNFWISFETDEKIEELYSLAINLTSGEINDNLFAELCGKKISPNPPKKHLEKRKIPYREGYNSLLNHLKWQLQNHDSLWVESAKSRWEEEVKYLEAFYRESDSLESGSLESGSPESGSDQSGFGQSDSKEEARKDTEANFYRRLAECYRKFRPVIKIHIINVGLLYLPVVHYTLESYDGTKSILIYDPVCRKIKVN